MGQRDPVYMGRWKDVEVVAMAMYCIYSCTDTRQEEVRGEEEKGEEV